MTLEEKVQAVLAASASVTAIVPASGPNGRIKTPGSWQNLARPYVVHFPVAAEPTYTHDGRAAMTRWPFYQVSCFGDSYSQARALSSAITQALTGNHQGVQFFWRGLRHVDESLDSDTPIQHIALDFEVFEAL